MMRPHSKSVRVVGLQTSRHKEALPINAIVNRAGRKDGDNCRGRQAFPMPNVDSAADAFGTVLIEPRADMR
jgi:hypothetical protein